MSMLDVPLCAWRTVLGHLDDCPVTLMRLRATCRVLAHDLGTPERGGLSAAWLRALSHLDPAGCLLRAFDESPLDQYLQWVERCEPPRWGGLLAVLAAPGCLACGRPTPYLHWAPRMPLARRCQGCRGRTPAHGQTGGAQLVCINSALFGSRPPIATVATEGALLAALAGAAHGDTIAVRGRITSVAGHGWGGESIFCRSVRLLGQGGAAELHAASNSLYLGFDAVLENLRLTSGSPGNAYGDEDDRFFAGFWGAGRVAVLKDCTLVGGSGTALVAGGPGGLLAGETSRIAAIRCTLRAPMNGIFFTLHHKSITRFLGCTFIEPPQLAHWMWDVMADLGEGGKERLLPVLVRRNQFPPRPVEVVPLGLGPQVHSETFLLF
jgi:hypothetical protein